jgi:hypothetical protein
MAAARVIVGSAAAAAVAAAGLALASAGGDEAPAELASVSRGCDQRVESRPIRVRAGRDTVIGPIAFYNLPAQFRPGAQREGRVGVLNAPPMKALAIVRPGRTVTVTVPPDQRAWMRLFYDRSAYSGAEGSHSVTFGSCRRSASTQFAGEISVDYAAAPDQGRCARLEVSVRGTPGTIDGHPFDPTGARCGD